MNTVRLRCILPERWGSWSTYLPVYISLRWGCSWRHYLCSTPICPACETNMLYAPEEHVKVESRGMSGDCNGLFTSSAIAVVVIQSLSPVWLSATPWTAAHRLPCSSSPPGVCSNSSPLDPWGHSVISSSVAPFISCPQSFLCYGLLHALRRFTHVAGQVHSVFSLIFLF